MDRTRRVVFPSVVEAFSLRRNLRALFVPPPSHLSRLAPLDGLRALSILWVVGFHAGWYSLWYVTPATYAALLASPWMLPLWRGDFGVDVFFVLSGFLIAGMLLDELRREGDVRVGLFQIRRFLRTWPALAVALGVDVALFHDNQSHAWLNLLYLSNFVPVAHVCMGWTWSLSIEEQFYLACPWLLRGTASLSTRARLWVLGLLALALCVIGAIVVVRGGYRVFDVEIAVNRPPERWRPAFDDLYTKPWMRAGALLAGVGAAVIHRTEGCLDRLAAARVGATIGALAALAVAVLATHWPIVLGAPRAVEVAYMATYRVAFATSIAYLMLFSLTAHPLGRALGKVLSFRGFYPIGQLSFAAYLLNPILTILVHSALAGWAARATTAPMLAFVPADLAATFAGAAVLHVAIERPGLRMRPRLAEPALAGARERAPTEHG